MGERVEFPLDEDQYKVLRESLKYSRSAAKVAGEIVLKIIEDVTKREDTAWNEAAKLCGFESFDHAHDQGKTLEISWLRKCIVVHDKVRYKPLVDDEDEDDGV